MSLKGRKLFRETNAQRERGGKEEHTQREGHLLLLSRAAGGESVSGAWEARHSTCGHFNPTGRGFSRGELAPHLPDLVEGSEVTVTLARVNGEATVTYRGLCSTRPAEPSIERELTANLPAAQPQVG